MPPHIREKRLNRRCSRLVGDLLKHYLHQHERHILDYRRTLTDKLSRIGQRFTNRRTFRAALPRLHCPDFSSIPIPANGHANHNRHTAISPHKSEDSNRPCHVVSTSLTQCPVNDVVVGPSFPAALALKHRECKRVRARRHGGLLLRRSAPEPSLLLSLGTDTAETRGGLIRRYRSERTCHL